MISKIVPFEISETLHAVPNWWAMKKPWRSFFPNSIVRRYARKNVRKFGHFSSLRAHISFRDAWSRLHVDVNIAQRGWRSAWINFCPNRMNSDWVLIAFLSLFSEFFVVPLYAVFCPKYFRDPLLKASRGRISSQQNHLALLPQF